MEDEYQEGFLAQALLQSLCGPGLREQFLAQAKTNNLCTCQCIEDIFADTNVDILPRDRVRKVCTYS